jgi:hypothetical protein
VALLSALEEPFERSFCWRGNLDAFGWASREGEGVENPTLARASFTLGNGLEDTWGAYFDAQNDWHGGNEIKGATRIMGNGILYIVLGWLFLC